ncbi:uncharacterized protein LOC107424318 [Ziziphus jujuba]|uniref:Uncharacterized protein LOC107424318 n=3 Tax=Ziziphus jujuba TaxID=326968 RepID=A0A6P4ALB2_ZIZJJ|nr:uncharacterized protein LOC107424318 [Ziziphus jujuba]XP_015889571.3 uncharacterized protein LOC107424318 [Ziziphus jujuba]
MSVVPSCSVSVKNSGTHLLFGSSSKPVEFCCPFSINPSKLGSTLQGEAKLTAYKTPLIVRAGGDDGKLSNASIFVGGFILGGMVVGTLGCLFAPQISKALDGTDRKGLMRRLPKFIYDEEKALQKSRKILNDKIEQLNSAIDEVSAQLRADHDPNGAAANPNEIEASI